LDRFLGVKTELLRAGHDLGLLCYQVLSFIVSEVSRLEYCQVSGFLSFKVQVSRFKSFKVPWNKFLSFKVSRILGFEGSG
jgi:hypothetical protein